jgi:L-amino acid N-acyltransferase YncA
MHHCRLAKLTDATAIQAIYAPIVAETPISFEYEVPDVAEIERRMQKVMASRPWLVYETGGQVLGYAYASTFRERAAYNWGVEVSIYVHANAHKRGIGQQLYTTLFDVLRALNYCQVYAGATVPNESSERLHARMGFELIARFPSAGYKFGKWHDTVFWRLPLRDFPEPAPEIGNINELVKTAEWEWLTRS